MKVSSFSPKQDREFLRYLKLECSSGRSLRFSVDDVAEIRSFFIKVQSRSLAYPEISAFCEDWIEICDSVKTATPRSLFMEADSLVRSSFEAMRGSACDLILSANPEPFRLALQPYLESMAALLKKLAAVPETQIPESVSPWDHYWDQLSNVTQDAVKIPKKI